MPGIEELLGAAGGASGITSGIQAGLGAVETAVGLIRAGKLKKQAAQQEKSRPKYTESPYFKDELKLAQSELSTGMSAEAKTAYEQGMDRDLSTSLSTILKGGGSVNNVASLFDQSAQGRQRLSLMKENLRLNQINNLSRAQSMVEEEREKAFQFNEWAPWADKTQAISQARQGAESLIWGGINTFGSGMMNMSNAKSSQGQLQDYFNSPENAGSSGPNLISNYHQQSIVNTPPVNSPAATIGTDFINPNYFNQSNG